MKATRQLSLGSSLLTVGRIATLGAFLGGLGGGPLLAAAAVTVLVVGGVTTSATCDVTTQLYDIKGGKTRWLGSASITSRKTLHGITGDKQRLSDATTGKSVMRKSGDRNRS